MVVASQRTSCSHYRLRSCIPNNKNSGIQVHIIQVSIFNNYVSDHAHAAVASSVNNNRVV